VIPPQHFWLQKLGGPFAGPFINLSWAGVPWSGLAMKKWLPLVTWLGMLLFEHLAVMLLLCIAVFALLSRTFHVQRLWPSWVGIVAGVPLLVHDSLYVLRGC